MTIELSTATIVYIASCITIVGGAIGILVRAKNALLQPLKDIDNKLKNHDRFLANDKAKLETIDYILTDLVEGVNVLVRTNRTMLEHLEDGNHTGEIKEAKKEIDDWLLKGKSYKGAEHDRP